MGRSLSGCHDFYYPYAFTEQPTNLAALGAHAGVGRYRLSLTLDLAGAGEGGWHLSGFAQVLDAPIDCDADSEVPVPPGRTVDDVFARAAHIIGTSAPRIRASFPDASRIGTVSLVGRVIYELERSDWQRLLTWINTFLDEPLVMEDLDGTTWDAAAEKLAWSDRVRPAVAVLARREAAELLPYMALYILAFARLHDTDRMRVEEHDPDRFVAFPAA